VAGGGGCRSGGDALARIALFGRHLVPVLQDHCDPNLRARTECWRCRPTTSRTRRCIRYPPCTKIESFYFFLYRHVARKSLSNVLVIGAGTGNDVGVALSEGARHVDAVEIDPDLVKLGREHNPEHAYQSPRVTVHIDDGRSFLQNTNQRYGLILYALPDSLTALTGQSAPVGLENYLLTTQGIQVARDHLARGGTFVMYNYYQPFLLDRYATALRSVFGTRPCVELGNTLSGRRQAVLTVASSGPTPNCSSYWSGRTVAPVSDDRPFPYLPTPSIPNLYLLVMGLILVGSLLVVRIAGGPFRRMVEFRGPLLDGGGLLAPRIQEHRAVRAVLRDDLVREFAWCSRACS